MSHFDQQIAFGPTTTVFLDDPAGVTSPNMWTYDPLDADDAADEIVVTSSRRLTRVVVAAADAGARFALEAPDQDAAAWMLAPRAVFDGRPAIEACQDLDGFTRSVVLHGLRLGLDADPAEIDDLIADDVFDPDCEGEDLDEIGSLAVDPVEVRLPRPLLLTSWIDCDDGSGRIFAFCGMVTDRPVDLVDRIIGRYGAVAAAKADFQVGFDRSTAMATAMVSDAMAHVLVMAAEDPTSPLARGLDVSVEQRFAA